MKYLAISLTLAACSILAAGVQNGALLEQQPFTTTDDELQSLSSNTAAAKVFEQVITSEIVYSSDGLKIRGFLARPRREGRYPCVIFNRGGNATLGIWTRARSVFLAQVASLGYVVVASQYRGGGGSEGTDEYGGADVDDVLNLIPLLESLPYADASRIGMVGNSRGGMMTYLALSRTKRIAAAVVTSGISDMFDSAQARAETMGRLFADLIPGYSDHRDDVLAARSAVRWAEKLNRQTPILLFHGTADWRVSPEQAFAMGVALYRARHPFRLVLFEGGAHGVPEYEDERQRILRDWLDKYVRDRQPWPSLEPHGN